MIISMACMKNVDDIFSNFHVFLVILTLHGIVETQSSGIPRCCVPGEVLVSREGNISCSLAPSDTKELYELDSGTHGLPVCQDDEDVASTPLARISNGIPGPACLDILYVNVSEQYPLVLHCFKNDKNASLVNVPRLLNVRRCCRTGEIFDVDRRACVPADEDVPAFSLVPNFRSAEYLTVVRGPPKCQHAIVDYEINSTDVFLDDGRLQVRATTANGIIDLLATEESACLDASSSSPGTLVVRACRASEFCRGNSCVRKCCPEDEALFISSCRKLPSNLTVAKWHEEIWNTSGTMRNTSKPILNATDYGLLVGKTCMYGMYPALPNERWQLTPSGHVYMPGYKTYEHNEYCMDMFYNSSAFEDGLYPFICFDKPGSHDEPPAVRFQVNAVLELTSCTFLLVTLLVYIFLPALQNLHGKTLMCHVASLFVAYACLAIVGIATPPDSQVGAEYDFNSICKSLGYMMYFSLLSSFSWLNVMCFDIWWTFGGFRGVGGSATRGRGHGKRFFMYALYAWGLALVMTISVVSIDHFAFLPVSWRPNMGVERCWFSQDTSRYGEITYFTGPVSTQLIVNMLFFISTIRSCSKVKAEIRRVMATSSDPRSKRFQADRTKLIMNAKLFIVMGISWILEIISYMMNNYATDLQWKKEFFYVSDAVNCLQGVLIFILFVLKRKVYHALRRRFGISVNRRASNGGIHDPYKVRKSASSSTLMSTFAVSLSP